MGMSCGLEDGSHPLQFHFRIQAKQFLTASSAKTDKAGPGSARKEGKRLGRASEGCKSRTRHAFGQERGFLGTL